LTPPLVVATASKPASSTIRADSASQALASSSRGGAWWRARKVSARCSCHSLSISFILAPSLVSVNIHLQASNPGGRFISLINMLVSKSPVCVEVSLSIRVE
jgi:hypothetical protein